MIIFKEAAALKNKLAESRKQGKKIGFVPTMGALHKGHLSLITASEKKCDFTICSIFVNPTQFNDPKDYEKYPLTIDNDILLLKNTGCDILFLPAVAEIYPAGTKPAVHYNLGDIEYLLEGKFRPGHFQGVCQVVNILLDIVNPDCLFMGEKDYQQCQVVKRLVRLIDKRAEVVTVSTVREETGLAMSSRNLRLSDEQKRNAAGIFKMLMYIKSNYTNLPLQDMENYAMNYLLNNGFHKADYVTIADADTLHPVGNAASGKGMVALVAAFIGEVRLIDNIVLTP